MNKHLHRVIFNARRSQRMAVAETASAQGKAASGETAVARQAVLCLTGLAALAFMSAASAQIKADASAAGNLRPTIVSTANGLPQVNIQTPSAAGVSRNVYSQFDVQAQGAILNNSRTDVQTQLGGWVQANPALASGSARVILNEVNSTSPSQLNGYVEVAGQRAEVVVANPAGIQVGGAGFINASGVTLTTGTPVMNAGNLESYRVQGGSVTVSGAGLDTRGADYTNILARAAQINAGIWAKDLRVVTGANQVNAASPTSAPTPIAGTGSAPAFALDVAALGGMYAGKIFLIGTEAGLGVNNRGLIGASAGDVVLQANGWLTNSGAVQASGNLSLTVTGSDASGTPNGISNSGTVYAAGNAMLSASGDIHNSALMAAGQSLTLAATGATASIQDTPTSVLASGMNSDGTLQGDASTQNLSLSAGQGLNLTGKVLSASSINLSADSLALAAGGQVSAGRDLTANATTLSNNGELLATGNNRINAGAVTNRGLIDGATTRIDSGAGTGSVSNLGSGRIYGDHLSIQTQTLTNAPETVNGLTTAPVIAARTRLDIGAQTISNSDHATILSAGDISIGGLLDANGLATGSATTLRNGSATIEALGNLNIAATDITNANDHFAYSIQLVNTQYNLYEAPWPSYYRIFNRYTYEPVVTQDDPGQIIASGNIQLSATQITNQQSKIVAGGALSATGASINNLAVTDQRRVNDVGTQWSWGVTGGHDSCWPCHWVLDWGMVPSAYNVNTYTTLTVAQGASPSYSSAGSVNTTFVGSSVTPYTASNTVTGQTATASGISGLGSALYRPPSSPTANYLVETDPRFASYRQWLSSDYLLQALGTDPATVQKRLGDGFYEQRLIREQVAQLTGRRFLGDYRDDEQQYRALMNAGVTYAQAHSLRPGIALTAEQVAQLTADIVWLVEKEVTLPNGTVQKALVPQLYAVPRTGELRPDGALLSGDSVAISSSGDTSNSGTLLGRRLVQINAGNINNLFGAVQGQQVALSAAQDINNIGGAISAEQSLSVSAGRDLSVVTQTSASTNGSRLSERLAGLYVTGAGGSLLASAGRDVNLVASALQSQGSASVQAAGSINLGAVTTGESLHFGASGEATFHQDLAQSTQTGSRISAGGNVSLNAGQSITGTATQINAQGDVALNAGADITLLAGQATKSSDLGWTATDKGLFSSSSTTTRIQSSSATAIASEVSGKTVTMASGQDTSIQGSNVIADQDVHVAAGRNLTIEAATNTSRSASFYQKSESGLLGGGGGIGITLGSREQSADQGSQGSTAAASTLGSVGGNVTLTAGKVYTQTGSDVLAPQGDVRIQAQTVNIVEARERSASQSEQKFSQSGVSLSVSNPVIAAGQTVQRMEQAASQTRDARMQALAAASTGLAVKQAADAVAKNPAQAGGVSISVSLGSASSQSSSTSNSTSARGSRVDAGGNVNVTAGGAGQSSDLTVRGSDIRAAEAATLQAEGDINLLAAANTVSQQSSQSSSSASIGVGWSSSSGFGVTLAASKGAGSGNGSETTYTNSQVTGQTIKLQSGTDTTLTGAQVKASQITAEVGGNLNIQSLQDTSAYNESSASSGFSVTVPIGAGSFGGSISASGSQIDSNYQSTRLQSGMQAGDGGFAVNVRGNTTLVGGVIASTDNAVHDNRNSFQTGGVLNISNLDNSASYKASSYSATLGTSGAGQLSQPTVSAGLGSLQGSAASTTTAGISGIAGNAAVRTGDAPTGIGKIFDANAVRNEINAQVTITAEFGKQAATAVGGYVQERRAALQEQARSAQTAQEKEQAQAGLKELATQERVMNVLIGAVTGLGTSALTKEGLSAAAAEMRQFMIEDSAKFAGVTDGTTTLSNLSGPSEGVRGDNAKVGGTRVDLDLLCGPDNSRCAKNEDGTLKFVNGQVTFTAGSLTDFLQTEQGQKMAGATGGIQGAKGTLFGIPYEAGSWQDKLIEAFSGTHDMIGGKLSGLYDEQGNATRGRSATTTTLQNRWSEVAILPAAPFAAAELLPPEAWNAISIFLKAAR